MLHAADLSIHDAGRLRGRGGGWRSPTRTLIPHGPARAVVLRLAGAVGSGARGSRCVSSTAVRAVTVAKERGTSARRVRSLRRSSWAAAEPPLRRRAARSLGQNLPACHLSHLLPASRERRPVAAFRRHEGCAVSAVKLVHLTRGVGGCAPCDAARGPTRRSPLARNTRCRPGASTRCAGLAPIRRAQRASSSGGAASARRHQE